MEACPDTKREIERREHQSHISEHDDTNPRKKRKVLQTDYPKYPDLHSHEFVESGRSLDVTFTFGGRMYKSPRVVDKRVGGALTTKLFLHFADYPCFSIVLRVTGTVEPSAPEGSRLNAQLQHTYYKFFAEDITKYHSYPLLVEAEQPKDFNISQQSANFDAPKRMINFEARNCWIHQVPLPVIEEEAIENEMGDLLEDVTGCMETGAVMDFTCTFDDYRDDGEAFLGIEESIEFDPFVPSIDGHKTKVKEDIKKEEQKHELSMETLEPIDEKYFRENQIKKEEQEHEDLRETLESIRENTFRASQHDYSDCGKGESARVF